MKYFLKKFTLFIFLFTSNANAQTLLNTSCNQSTTGIQVILAPNSSTTIPSSATNFGNYYLCGPNTNMYDTLPNANGCRNVFVNSGCNLITKSTGCFAYEVIYAKNSSTVVIRPGANVSTKIVFEPLAVIINQAGITNTFACSSITFPTVNCGVTFISESKALDSQIEIYPNPTTDKLNIQFTSDRKEVIKAQIINNTGQVVKAVELNYNDKQISIGDLPSGVYLLNLKDKFSSTLQKRFVVAR